MKWRHTAVLLLMGAIFGSSFPLIRLGLESFAPLTLVAIRLTGAALLLTLVLYLQGHRLPASPDVWRDLVLVGAVGIALPNFLITRGEQAIAAGLAAILTATTPLFTLVLAFLWTREERLGAAQLLGIGLGFAGVLVALDVARFDLGASGAGGQFAVLIGAACYAFGGLYGRKALQGQPAVVSAAGTMAGGALVVAPLALWLDGLPTASPTLQALIGVLSLTVLSSAVAYILFFWLLARVGAARAALVTYLVPIFALFFGWLWLGERLGGHAVAGLALVLPGIMAASVGPRRSLPRRTATSGRGAELRDASKARSRN